MAGFLRPERTPYSVLYMHNVHGFCRRRRGTNSEQSRHSSLSDSKRCNDNGEDSRGMNRRQKRKKEKKKDSCDETGAAVSRITMRTGIQLDKRESLFFFDSSGKNNRK